MEKISQLATGLWLLVGAPAIVQSSNVISNGFGCVRTYLLNQICHAVALEHGNMV